MSLHHVVAGIFTDDEVSAKERPFTPRSGHAQVNQALQDECRQVSNPLKAR